jgi:hypothetical protein
MLIDLFYSHGFDLFIHMVFDLFIHMFTVFSPFYKFPPFSLWVKLVNYNDTLAFPFSPLFFRALVALATLSERKSCFPPVI